MIVFLTLCFVALIYCLIRTKVLPDNALVRATPIGFAILLLVFLFIPMQWGAPSGSAVILRHSVQIVSNVSGQVTDVPVTPNAPLKKGDVLFRIDPTLYKAKVDQLIAQLKLAELRLEQYAQLERRNAGSKFRVQEARANVSSLKAQMSDAQWKLDQTIIRAPSNGYATAIALRPGARVATLPLAPAMAFIDTSETILAAQVPQTFTRYIKVGNVAEVTFKALPGQVFAAHVEKVLPAISEGQVVVSGMAAAPRQLSAKPFVVRLKLDDKAAAKELPAGAFGQVAIYTSSVQGTHLIRKVMLRMQAWTNYLLPI